MHPYIAANFPGCPAWFNEGLASLYEQSGEEDGQIWGYTNWRLRGLHAAIQRGDVPSFQTLCGTTTREFYADESRTNYAQARYLCYYLQKKERLSDFYRDFRRAAKTDLTGYQTLRRVLGEPDMNEFQREWQEFVLDLRF